MEMYLWVAAVAVVMLLVGYFWGSRSKTGELMRLTSERDVLQSKVEGATERLAEQKAVHEQALAREHQRGSELKEAFEKRLGELRQTHSQQLENLKQNNEEQIKALRELNEKQLKDQLATLSAQMQVTSEKVLKQRQEELGERNKEQVSLIIDPLQDSLKQMQKALEDSKERQNETMTRLDETIKLNIAKSQQLGQSADRLYNALTSEVKVQGNFGEMQLRQLLENLGLEEGVHFTSQAHLRDKTGGLKKDEEGRGLIPDFILHFPNKRDVVVDSKMSFTAYERYVNCDNPEERSVYLRDHIASVRAQVDRLASKQYSRYLPEGYNHLDFVIMYVNIEGAFTLALSSDPTLWRYAYDKGVLIFGSQTMYMNLRVLNLMWTQVKQLTNQQEMVEAANQIVERVQMFAERFQTVEKKMNETVTAIEAVKKSTAESGPGIITAAKKLVKAGARESKKKRALDDLERSTFLESESSGHFLDAPDEEQNP